MATVTSDNHGFPEGALVGVYPVLDVAVQANHEEAPVGAAIDAVYVEDGVLEYEDLDPGTYQLAAPVNGLFVGGGTNASFVVTPKQRQTIRVELIDPEAENEPLAVAVTDRLIEVTLATGSEELDEDEVPVIPITTTAADIVNLLSGDSDCRALVTAELAEGHSGEGVVTAQAGDANGSPAKWRYVTVVVPPEEEE